jgi:antitoxin (DNA-binding transcriptional repressor) of toxin-antitoxin stability system
MSKELTVEELREKPDALIDAIDKGETVTITRDGKQIATTNPVLRTGYRGMPYPFRDFDWGPRPKMLDIDPAEIIIEERERERSGKKYGL